LPSVGGATGEVGRTERVVASRRSPVPEKHERSGNRDRQNGTASRRGIHKQTEIGGWTYLGGKEKEVLARVAQISPGQKGEKDTTVPFHGRGL